AAHRFAPAPAAGPGQGRGPAFGAQGRSARARARGVPAAARGPAGGIRRGRRDRSPLSPPGRDRDPVGGDHRPPDARGPDRDRPRPREPGAGAGPDRGTGEGVRATPARAVAVAQAGGVNAGHEDPRPLLANATPPKRSLHLWSISVPAIRFRTGVIQHRGVAVNWLSRTGSQSRRGVRCAAGEDQRGQAFGDRSIHRSAKGGLLRTRVSFSTAIAASVAVSVGLAAPALASSSGRSVGGARGARAAKSTSFAGYSVQAGGEGSWKVAAQFVVPTVKCTGGSSSPERAIEPSVGVYSSSFSSAGIFVGCFKGKADYFVALVLN